MTIGCIMYLFTYPSFHAAIGIPVTGFYRHRLAMISMAMQRAGFRR